MEVAGQARAVRDFRSEQVDLTRVMDQYGPITSYCTGGRIIAAGYVCPHCGSRDPQGECLSPIKR